MTLARTRRLLAGVILLSLPVATVEVAAQELTLPDWMRSSARDLPREVFPAQTPAPVPPPAASPRVDVSYAGEPYVVERAYVRVRYENDGTGRREVEGRIRVQSPSTISTMTPSSSTSSSRSICPPIGR